MSAAIVVVLAAIVTGIAYLHGLRSTQAAKRSNTGWYGLAVLALLFAGLLASGQAGNEAAAYGYGTAIALALSLQAAVGEQAVQAFLDAV